MKLRNAVLLLSLPVSCWSASPYDWRFADPASQLIAGSAISPGTTDPVGGLLFFALTPLGRVPATFRPALSKVTSVSYSLTTAKDDIAVLTGTFDYASLRSAGGTIGLVSTFYRGIEMLSPAVPSGRVALALISPNTVVLASVPVTKACIDRYLTNPTGSASNPLILQAATYTPGFDLFAMSSGFSVSQALAFLYPKGAVSVSKRPALQTAFNLSTAFKFRARLSNVRLELAITEPDAGAASSGAAALSALLAGIKATGPNVADLLTAVATNTTVQAVGSEIDTVVASPVYSLTTKVVPTGTGTITPNPAGIPFAANSLVSLTATPGACYGTASWSANAPGGFVTLTSNQEVTATFPPSGAAALASTVTVSQGGFRLNRTTGRYQQSIALNNSGATLTNVSLIFDNVSAGAALYLPDGQTVCAPAGSFFRNIASLPPALTNMVVEFTVANPSQIIQYTPRVLAGAGSR